MSLRSLIIDDNVSFLEASRTMLERQGLLVVGVATTPEEGLQRCEELAPELILVDIDLGEESGFELARRLKAGPAPANAQVVLISAHLEDDFADLIEDSPAVGFLPKSELSLAAIQGLLGDAAAPKSP
jgi:CheY-like chemotaxis protein